jgi:hypothetical protein
MSVLVQKLIADIKSQPELSDGDLRTLAELGTQAAEEFCRRRQVRWEKRKALISTVILKNITAQG